MKCDGQSFHDEIKVQSMPDKTNMVDYYLVAHIQENNTSPHLENPYFRSGNNHLLGHLGGSMIICIEFHFFLISLSEVFLPFSFAKMV